MSTSPIRVLVADNHPMMLDALCSQLAGSAQFTVVARARSFREVVAAAQRHPADVVILDLGDMGGSPLVIVQRLQRDHPQLKILVFSATVDLAPEMLNAGAAGYVAKEELSPVLLEAITAVAAGQPFCSPFVQEYLAQSKKETALTPKELVALKLLAQGRTTLEIAATMRIDPRSVQNHITAVLRKTGCAQRVQLVDWYRRTYGISS